MFSDTLEASRDHLETGNRVTVQVEANLEADQLKLLARGVTPVDDVVEMGQGPMGLRVFVDQTEAVSSVANLLERMKTESKTKGRAPVHLCLMAPDLPGEVEVILPDPFPVSPQIKGALKSLPGVSMVEEV